MSYYAPPMNNGPQPQHPYGAPPPPPMKKGMSGKKIALIVAGVFVGMQLMGLLGFFLLFQMGKATVQSVFKTCDTTPSVTAISIDTLLGSGAGYELKALESNCNRDETAVVKSDYSEAWLSAEKVYTDSDTLVADTKKIYLDNGWVTEGDTLTKDGYSLSFEPHSYAPAMIKVRIERDSPQTKNAWDDKRIDHNRTYMDMPLSEEDIRKYALLPDYAPSYMPQGYGEWIGYGAGEKYDLETSTGRGYTPHVVVQFGNDLNEHWACKQNGPCEPYTVFSDGTQVYRSQPDSSDRYDYFIIHEGKIISYSEGLWIDPQNRDNHARLQESDILQILDSIDLTAQAPAKTDVSAEELADAVE